MAAYTSVQGVPLREELVTYLRPDFPDERSPRTSVTGPSPSTTRKAATPRT